MSTKISSAKHYQCLSDIESKLRNAGYFEEADIVAQEREAVMRNMSEEFQKDPPISYREIIINRHVSIDWNNF